MKRNKIFLIIGIIIVIAAFLWLLQGGVIVGFLALNFLDNKVEVNTDISKYQDYIGETAADEYRNKWGMDESIFPREITENMKVKDYKMVYYNPWDAQYLSYLVVQYDADTYQEEVKRLEAYPSEDYLPIGFDASDDNPYQKKMME